jgi:aldehyde dehydrogenase (NAD+)
VPGRAGKTFKVYNPVTEEPIYDIYEALPEDVDLAVNAAQNAFPAWSEKNAFERALPLAKLSQLVLRDAEELAKLDALVMGKYDITAQEITVRSACSLSYSSGH